MRDSLFPATLLAALLGLAAPAGAQTGASRLALVVGNGTYPSLAPLPACAASAHVVSAALRHAGFEVTEKLDASNGEMGAAIGGFVRGIADAAAGVLYVCGYAADLNGRDFLLPASANLERATDALSQGLLAKSLLDAVGRSGVHAGLVLLDAVAVPPGTQPLRLEALGQPAFPATGFAGAASATPPPNGATAFAAGIAAALAPPQVEVGAALRSLAVGGPAKLAVVPPTGPAWLVGGPAAATPAPAPPTPPTPPAVASIAPPSPVVAPMPDEAHMGEADRRRIQDALMHLGYYAGSVDGDFGPDTRAAIRRFQHEIGADMVGRLTPAQSARLLADPHAR